VVDGVVSVTRVRTLAVQLDGLEAVLLDEDGLLDLLLGAAEVGQGAQNDGIPLVREI
jgi:hypothetical protein